MLPSPVGISRKFIALVGLIIGGIIGSSIALFYGLLKENKIGSAEEIDVLVDYPIICELSIRFFTKASVFSQIVSVLWHLALKARPITKNKNQ